MRPPTQPIAHVRFNGFWGIPKLLTVPAHALRPETAAAVVQAILSTDGGSPERDAALDRMALEAFPQETWRTRLVRPRARLAALAGDLLLQMVRSLSAKGGALHGF